jgi:hypothetical protein
VCKPAFGYFTPVPQSELTRKDATQVPPQSPDTSDVEAQDLREPAYFGAYAGSDNYSDYEFRHDNYGFDWGTGFDGADRGYDSDYDPRDFD